MKLRKDRVRAHTAAHLNEQIDVKIQRDIERIAARGEPAIARRIAQLDDEWDVERYLEMNASALALTGTLLGIFVNKKFLAIPCIVLPFLFQHAVQGWCPPIPLLRRRGVRTRKEIDAEKYALKALRGDFSDAAPTGTVGSHDRGRQAWRAANA
jgi:hypothetical protein